jgi:hypothetical protein
VLLNPTQTCKLDIEIAAGRLLYGLGLIGRSLIQLLRFFLVPLRPSIFPHGSDTAISTSPNCYICCYRSSSNSSFHCSHLLQYFRSRKFTCHLQDIHPEASNIILKMPFRYILFLFSSVRLKSEQIQFVSVG